MGLEPIITSCDGVTYPTLSGCTHGQVLGTRFVRSIYDLVDNEPRWYTISLLWDTKTHTIVSNESADILRMFNTSFRGLATSQVDLLPEDRAKETEVTMVDLVATIDADWFASALSKEKDLKPAFLDKTFADIQRIEDVLANSRFLVGNTITEPNIALFHAHPHLRELYQTPAIKASVKWDHVRLMFINFNETLREPTGPFIDYDAAHDRARFDIKL